MRTGLLLAALVAFGCCSAQSADPAPGTVRLKVTKKTSKDRKTIDAGLAGHFRENEINNSVSYTIDLTNLGSRPLKDVHITWAVLLDVRGRHGGAAKGGGLQVVEGVTNITVAATKTFSFETAPFQLTEWQRERTNVGPKNMSSVSKTGSEIEGYAVEVTLDGKPLAAETDPKDIRPRIDAARAAQAPKNKK